MHLFVLPVFYVFLSFLLNRVTFCIDSFDIAVLFANFAI